MLRSLSESFLIHAVIAAFFLFSAGSFLNGGGDGEHPVLLQMSTSMAGTAAGGGDAADPDSFAAPVKSIKKTEPVKKVETSETVESLPEPVAELLPDEHVSESEPAEATQSEQEASEYASVSGLPSSNSGQFNDNSSAVTGNGNAGAASAEDGVSGDSVFSLKELDSRPSSLSNSKPEYPRYAKENRIEGNVTVSFILNEKGYVMNPKIIKASPVNVFETTALAAVQKWRFSPAKKNGEAVSVYMVVPINFSLKEY